MTGTQNQEVYEYLKDHGKISSQDAFIHLGITRLSARIWDLRHKHGIAITTETAYAKNRRGKVTSFAEYRLEADA